MCRVEEIAYSIASSGTTSIALNRSLSASMDVRFRSTFHRSFSLFFFLYIRTLDTRVFSEGRGRVIYQMNYEIIAEKKE